MKKKFMLFMVVLSMVILLSPCTPQAAGPTTADFYKDKIVTILVSTPPGSSNDIFTRLTADYLSKLTGARIGIENKPAAGGSVCQNNFYEIVEPDGLTLMVEATGRIWPGYIMGEKRIKYDSSKFEYIAGMGGGPFMLGVSPKGPYGTIEDLKKAKDLKVPTSTATSILTLGAMAVSEALSLDAKIVLGNNSKAAYLALQQGEGHFMVRSFASIIQYQRQNAIKPLVQMGEERDPLCPDLPTIYELATLSDYQKRLMSVMMFTEARVFLAPPGTPKDRVKFWDDCITKVLNNSELQNKLADTMGVWFGIFPASKAQKELSLLVTNRDNFKLFSPLIEKYVK